MVVKNLRPKWWLLYAALPLGAALLVAADLVSPSAGGRVFTESLASLLTIGAIAIWVHANRVALALPGKPPQTGQPLRAWVAYCPPRIPRRALDLPEIKHFQLLVAPSVQENDMDATCCAK